MRKLCMTVVAVFLLACVTHSANLLGDDTVRTPPATAEAFELPSVFSKPVPEGVSDLRAIETHVSQLARRVRPFTVGLRIETAKGSGVIISEDGYILTAAHVSNRVAGCSASWASRST